MLNIPHMNLRENLEQNLGIIFSDDWYDDCSAALRQHRQQQNRTITADMIFEQMLYHDLRDVVRGHRSETPFLQRRLPPPAQMLRNAITQSLEPSETASPTSSCSGKITLPSSFRCCLQLEEVCDVSKNAESRFVSLSTMSSSSSCHKLCLIDGYYPGQAFVAVEVSPILGSGVIGGPKLLPGTKILLFGPIIVRHGMIGVHDGNCIILGGQVERLIQIQHQAIEKAKQLSGHGIDPTIRALIWNNRPNDEDENDGDEGEQESGDVTPAQPMTVAHPPIITQAQPLTPVQVSQVNTQPMIQRVSYPSTVSTNPSQPSQNGNRVPPNQHITTAGTTATSNSVAHVSMTSIQNASSSLSSTVLPQNRYASGARTQPPSNTIVANVHLPVTRPDANSTILIENSPQYQDTTMSYSQFCDFLKRILTNEHEYRQSMHKVYRVGPMQQVGPKLYFNIERASKRHKPWHDLNLSSSSVALSAESDDKQQGYVIISKFGIANDAKSPPNLVTCRIANSILEPHFPVSATELRKLSKANKQKSDLIVRDSGKIAQQYLYQMQVYEVMLDRSADEIFDSAQPNLQLDGEDPFLLLKRARLDM